MLHRLQAAVVALALVAGMAAARQAAPQHPEAEEVVAPVAVELDEVTVGDVSSDRVQLNVALHLTAKKDLTIRSIAFAGLRANGLPLYVAPFKDELALKKDKPLSLPRPLMLNVYYRDLESLQPLAKMLEDERAHVAGTALVEVSVGGLARLVVGSRARVPVAFQQDVPVRVPGGSFGHRAAVMVVRGADATLQRVQVGVESGARMFSEWRRELWEQYAPAVVLVQARYTLRNKAGEVAQEFTAAGLRIGTSVVVPKEALAPWKFDPEITASMKQEGYKVRDFDLWIWPEDATLHPGEPAPGTAAEAAVPPWKLSAKQLRPAATPEDDEEAVFVPVTKGRPTKVSVHRRESAANVAVVEVSDPAAQPLAPKLEPAAQTNEWASVAVFRFPEGAAAKTAHPDLVFVAVQRDGDRLRLQSPVDSSALGSPLIAPEGVIGMVQSENQGLPLAGFAKLLKLPAPPSDAGQR